MAAQAMSVEQILDQLALTPERLIELTKEVPSARLSAAPVQGEWSPNEILAHLRSCADVWGGSIATILADDHPTIRAINPRTWIKRTDYSTLDFHASLDAFVCQRAALLEVLRPLTGAQWSRLATIRGAGAPLQKDVLSFAHRMAIHERAHLKQLERTVR